jgi:predicted DCC family thiol-disulfide oxidoreductase YuxK
VTSLTVLYDASCPLCARCAAWLRAQRQYLDLQPVAAGSAEARRRFPDLEAGGELLVVSSEGALYEGADAYIMCLWALERFRPLALRLATPPLKPFARAAFWALSRGRQRASQLLGLPDQRLGAAVLEQSRYAGADLASCSGVDLGQDTQG